MRIDFIIGGVQKGGTTALAEFVGQHPDVGLSNVKEPHYFDRDELWSRRADDHAEYHQRHWDWNAPVKSYLPDFELQDKAAEEQATAIDLLTHRIGLPRHDLAWIGSTATRELAFNIVNASQAVLITQTALPDAIVGEDYCNPEPVEFEARNGGGAQVSSVERRSSTPTRPRSSLPRPGLPIPSP